MNATCLTLGVTYKMSEPCGCTINFVYLHSQERNVKKQSVWDCPK